MREVKRTRPVEKGKGKGHGGKGEHEDKGREFGSKGRQQGTRLTEDEELEEQGPVTHTSRPYRT